VNLRRKSQQKTSSVESQSFAILFGASLVYLWRTLMWMQPAPAHHLGPMRMRLREPAWTNPLCRVASHALFGLGGWGPVPPRLVERRDPAATNPTPQAKSPGRPENHRRALAGRTGAASGKSSRLMPNSPPPATPPSSRGSWPRANRIESDALATGGHAGRDQIIRSRRGWSVRPGTSHRSIPPTIKPPDSIQKRSQCPDQRLSAPTGAIEWKVK
jgi:hypothetical protein